MASHKAQATVVLVVLGIIGIVIYLLSQQQSDRTFKGRNEIPNPQIVRKALSTLYMAKQMETEFIATQTSKSEVYQAFMVVVSSADKAQLKSLVQHGNPVARCYGILALVNNNDLTTLKTFAKQLTQDNSEFRMMTDKKLLLQTVAQCYAKFVTG